MTRYASVRTRQLGAIHVESKKLGLDDGTYRDLLQRVAGVRSAAKLDAVGRSQVLDELRRLAGGSVRQMRNAVPPPEGAPTNVRDEVAALVGKIGALLADGGKSWNYGHGIAKRMYHVQRLEWLRADQLHRVVAALSYDQRRRRKQAQENSHV